LKRYEPIVVIDESRGRLTASGAAMEAKFDGRWIRYSDVFPAPSKPTLLNGLTEQETAASASVAGLSGAQPEAPVEPSDKWEGAEEWMPLAWALCANECGEEACTELIWEGGPIKEPWGDRWLKYEDQAKEMIVMVRKHVATPTPAPVAQHPAELTGVLRNLVKALDATNWSSWQSTAKFSEELDRARDAIKAQGGSQ
jgi:hypothetical protein